MKTKTKIRSAILMIVVAATFAGCASTPAERIKANPQLFASIAPKDQQLIQQGQVAIGFTPNMVLLALGEPDAVTRHTDANGSTEIWRYQNIDPNTNATVYMGWGWPNTYWDWQPARTDFLRVSFGNGRVTEINQLR